MGKDELGTAALGYYLRERLAGEVMSPDQAFSATLPSKFHAFLIISSK